MCTYFPDEVSTERRMAKNQHRMQELRNQIDEVSSSVVGIGF